MTTFEYARIDDRDKAITLNAYFANNFTRDNGFLPNFNDKSRSNSISYVTFSACAVEKALRKVRKGCAAGPDKLPSIFFNNLCDSLCNPFSLIFNASMCSGDVPDM